ncbi:patatin-like phospholipase family protein [Comamonas sp. NLF-1-9]|uniref:patatin-like phospholipase family protein n=1 Tax=Comamonas sp. NLF-1-9 TaxID=2853163 RepID=UPI001C4824D1|nr:patatin-like phospholipase family protein [Comamonas sp. NLF-1-9]QXL85497.1 patatin-like phospholipase family protein [Comamonas sp. NLF-1-9]
MPEPKLRLALNLALQGGGSHGAFTWGVLDALLEDGRFALDGISGTSAGAMNAVAVAQGFALAASQSKDREEIHRQGCALARETLRTLWEGVGRLGAMLWGVPLPGNPLVGMMSQWFSPYQTNPLDINPLRKLLRETVDFALLHAEHAQVPKVFVCATNVRTGRGEIFSGEQLSIESVMASACLPMMFQAVKVGEDHYWDGGYSGNPALYPLIYHTDSSDVLLVQINPVQHLAIPENASDIVDRINEVTFNASLLAELRAIAFVRRLLREGKLDPARYKDVRVHRIDGGEVLAPFGAASKSRADTLFLRQLFQLGREEGKRWLHAHHHDVGVRCSVESADDV